MRAILTLQKDEREAQKKELEKQEEWSTFLAENPESPDAQVWNKYNEDRASTSVKARARGGVALARPGAGGWGGNVGPGNGEGTGRWCGRWSAMSAQGDAQEDAQGCEWTSTRRPRFSRPTSCGRR